ncbi:MAG: hypothetical protein WBN41_01695 [Lysobacterales bacterium]
MDITVNTTGIVTNTNGIMPITTGSLMPGDIIMGTVEAIGSVMFHMRNRIWRRGWSLVHITGLQVLKP